MSCDNIIKEEDEDEDEYEYDISILKIKHDWPAECMRENCKHGHIVQTYQALTIEEKLELKKWMKKIKEESFNNKLKYKLEKEEEIFFPKLSEILKLLGYHPYEGYNFKEEKSEIQIIWDKDYKRDETLEF